MVMKVFKGLTGRNTEAYVDNILVKSHSFEQRLRDLHKVFGVLKAYRMKLNPTKCMFGMKMEKFLGLMVSMNGIKKKFKEVESNFINEFTWEC